MLYKVNSFRGTVLLLLLCCAGGGSAGCGSAACGSTGCGVGGCGVGGCGSSESIEIVTESPSLELRSSEILKLFCKKLWIIIQ